MEVVASSQVPAREVNVRELKLPIINGREFNENTEVYVCIQRTICHVENVLRDLF